MGNYKIRDIKSHREMKISSFILALAYQEGFGFKIETQEANGFLSRTKRASSTFSFEELRSPDFQRECIDESCDFNELLEVFDKRKDINSGLVFDDRDCERDISASERSTDNFLLPVPKSCLNMVKVQLDAFEAYGRDGNQVKTDSREPSLGENMLTDAKAVWNKISSGVLTGVKEVAEGTEEIIQSDEVQSAVDGVVGAFDEIKNAFKGFINVNCDDVGKIRETAYKGPK